MSENIPKPYVETVSMLRELAAHLVGGQEMAPTTLQRLRSAVDSHKDQLQLYLAGVGSHKMMRFSRLLGALDLGLDHLTSVDHLAKVKNDPRELRRHVELLAKLTQEDVAFMQKQATKDPEKHGHTPNATQTFNNLFVVSGTVDDVGDGEVTADGRRTIEGLLFSLQAAMSRGGKPPEPPRSEARKQRAKLVADIKRQEGSIDGGNGTGDHGNGAPPV